MPRPKKPGAPEPKRRSRKGCCGEEKPSCINCKRQGDKCDYSIRLNWEGRARKRAAAEDTGLNSESIPSPLSPATPNLARDGASGSPASSVKHVFMPLQQYLGPHLDTKQQSDHGEVLSEPFGSPIIPVNDSQPLSGLSACLPRTSVDLAWLPYTPKSSSYASSGQSTSPSHHQKITAGESCEVTSPSSSTLVQHVDPQHLSTTAHTNYIPTANNTGIFRASELAIRESLASCMAEDTLLQFPLASNTSCVNTPADMHRVSVSSLLSIPSGPDPRDGRSYGLDCGQPDLDVHRDAELLASLRDTSTGGINNLKAIQYQKASSSTATPSSSQEDISAGVYRSVTTVFSKGGYYAKPVPILIPRLLSPLPPTLLESPINMLYFHHFINHTARILVPHDCYLNPFATVLPAMAIEDENILNLLLAYSASHRSRLLGHAEPYTRIARWTSGVFPSLRHALGDPQRRTSAATLATAIMLVSLKVISPSTFEVPIRWETHLMTAREIFLTRQKTDPEHFTGKVNTFLHRWLVYLDLFGSLSSRRAEAPLFNGTYWPLDTATEYPKKAIDQEFEVDCFTGFTPRCCSLLARLSALTHQCDNVRVDPAGRLFTSWNPPASVLAKAERLLQDMEDAGPERRSTPMTHHGKPVDHGMAAMDEAYRLAGMIHLHRRVLGRETSDPIVIDLVDALFDSLDQVSRGGQEEVCILFPLFTAGCESQNEDQRQQVSERVQGFESVGMKQIRGARKLMQKSWRVGLPWNVLADGEFLA
ncbi:Protein of unknown function DUF3468 [Trichophyton rubrum]|nr:Protein of unknown function DUF3468 [Trichophyton rubrum]